MVGSTPGQRRGGFTLIELLVVIAIIAVLVGMLLAAVQKVRASANRIKCSNQLKQIGLAIHNYHDNSGFLPPTAKACEITWTVLILPYLEQDNLFKQWNLGRDYSDPNQSKQAKLTTVNTYFCP